MAEHISVLLVDEDPDILEVTATFLERADEDLDVETETSAQAALQAFEVDPDAVDCIISDYTMPELTGVEFLEAVREIEPDMPFFVFTGREREDVEAELGTESFTGYLKKGTGTDRYADLAAEIRAIVEA